MFSSYFKNNLSNADKINSLTLAINARHALLPHRTSDLGGFITDKQLKNNKM